MQKILKRAIFIFPLAAALAAGVFAAEPDAGAGSRIQLAVNPSVSPDGTFFVFEWKDRVWLAQTEGGTAVPLGDGMSVDTRPILSPDGKRVAFMSDRWGKEQLFEAELDAKRLVATGTRQITFHTESFFTMRLHARRFRDACACLPRRCFREFVQQAAFTPPDSRFDGCAQG